MLRTLVFALAIGLPSLAAADQFPQSAQDVEVVSDDGSVIGRVARVERNAEGYIVAAEIPGLEPRDAPRSSRDLIAEERREFIVRVSGEDMAREQPASAYDRRVLR